MDGEKVSLLPCPFCGGKASFSENGIDFRPVWDVTCDSCEAWLQCGTETQDDAAADWNTRALPPTDKDAESRGYRRGIEDAAKVADRVAAVEGNPGMPLDDVIHSTWKSASEHIASEIRALPGEDSRG